MARRSGASKGRSGGAKGSLAQRGTITSVDFQALTHVETADLASIQMMAAAALKEDNSGDESDDANLSDDPELVAELGALHPHQEEETAPQPPPRVASRPPGAVQVLPTSPAPTSPATSPSGELPLVETLQERLRSYAAAESAAKSLGDSSKARRYGRAIKTLESLLKKAKAGAPVSEEEIPPPVAIPKPPAPASEVSHEFPKVAKLDGGRNASDTPLSEQPTPAGDSAEKPAEASGPGAAPTAPTRRPAPPIPTRPDPTPAPAPKAEPPASTGSPQEQLLATRRDQYKRAAINAKKRGDQQAAISYVRTAKQFDAVLTAMAQGQPVDLSKMPPPPPEFQGPGQAAAAPAAPPSVPTAEARTQASGDNTPVPSYIDENVEDDPSLFGGPPPPATIMEALQQRLDKYKSTFSEAKEQGNDRKARRLERIVKVLGQSQFPPSLPLLQSQSRQSQRQSRPLKPAAKPAAPQPGAAAARAAQPGSGSPKKPLRRGLSTTIDKQMQFLQERQRLFREAALEAKRRGEIEQAKQYLRTMKGIDPMIQATECGLPIDASSMCVQNKDHFFKLGDVASGTKFEKLAQDTNRDLLVVKNLRQRNDPLPRFHYETRVFSIVRCNHDLTDTDIEVSIVRGVNLPGCAADGKNQNGEGHKQSRGFLRSDALIGTASVKFEELENKCEIHNSYDVFDSKRPSGGKLEVKVRVREPFVSKQVEEIRHRWLIIGS
ncbi:hypothetical protein HPB49_015901 [Dermacentor silvarum]|uniref:Uncharacterized protein n=1 Tax=Dermacentor silvarum TaxID=543639 RepID=A0ACB8DPP1_DERSI|nr:hypothetical protein HPB49_015901 [Dermacentor silvarum]